MSQSVIELQNKIGVKADGSFGPGTAKAIMNHYKMSRNRTAHFIAQCSHESAGFTVMSENLNYSAEGLLKIFGKYFKTMDVAKSFERQPQKIANRVYANRNGNGNEASGDGWKFRGRGAIQLTGKANYQAFANHINDQEIMKNPDLVSTKYAFESAMFFFVKNGIWSIADRGISDPVIIEISKIINGGTNGLEDRKTKTRYYYSVLG